MVDKAAPYYLTHRNNIHGEFTTIFVTTPPQERTIKFYDNRYTIQIPQTFWGIWAKPYGNSLLNVGVNRVHFLKFFPYEKINRGLYVAPFPNTYWDGSICHPFTTTAYNASLTDIINTALEAYWGEPFNTDIAATALKAFRLYNSPQWNTFQSLTYCFELWQDDASNMPWKLSSWKSLRSFKASGSLVFNPIHLLDTIPQTPNAYNLLVNYNEGNYVNV